MPRLPATLLALTCLLAGAAHAQPMAPGNAQIVIAPDREFTLEEAVALSLQKNFGLRIQAVTRDNAKANVEIQEAGFDPTLTANVTRSVNQSASTTSRLDGTAAQGPRNDNTVMRAGVSLPKISATNATLGLSTNLSKAATNSQIGRAHV